MPATVPAIIAYCAGRYNETHRKVYQLIINTAHDLQLTALDPERDLLDWLSKPHADPELVKACKKVLEHIGTAPRAT